MLAALTYRGHLIHTYCLVTRCFPAACTKKDDVQGMHVLGSATCNFQVTRIVVIIMELDLIQKGLVLGVPGLGIGISMPERPGL